MKRLAAFIAALACSTVLAQSTVTIPSRTITIPAQTITIPAQTLPVVTATTPPPVTCTPPQVLQNGTCVTPPPPPPPTAGSFVMTGQGANSTSLAWPAMVGAARYKVYRNGAAYGTSATNNYTSFIDANAPNATVSSYNSPATLYAYGVAPVDANGVEGAQITGVTYWVLNNGVMNWQEYSYGLTTAVSASGLNVTVTAAGSGFQPYAGGNVPIYDLELGAFTRMRLDLQISVPNQTFNLSAHSRVPQPPGDVYSTQLVHVERYCALAVGQKVTCIIPLADFHMGKTNFVGSITGNTMTVTQADKMLIDRGGFVTGPGVKAGTWIQNAPDSGGPGTYTVQPSQTVASASMAYQRTHLYKFDLMEQSGGNGYRLDNIGFTN